MWLIELFAEIEGVIIQKTFPKEHILIGRAESNDLVLHDPRMSSLHGQIVLRDTIFIYQDLQSTNGSMVESAGERFVVDGVKFKEHELKTGDQLLLGDVKHPVSIRVRIFEGEAEGEEKEESGKTILATRAISDFSLLSQQILDDKSMVRSLFRFQKEIHEKEKGQDIYQQTALFLLNNIPNAEYVSLHREENILESRWKQIYFTSKVEDISQSPKGIEELVEEACEMKRAVLISSEELIDVRLSADSARPLGAMIIAPLIHQEKMIGLIEIGNTKDANPLSEGDLEFTSVVSYVLSSRLVNLKLLEIVKEAEEKLKNENLYLKSIMNKEESTDNIVGSSSKLQYVKRQIATVGPSDLTVLIIGETGTGKELIAKSLHKNSHKSKNIIASVNCGTFSDTLLESELFGHVKGAFTGAISNKKGLFEVADGGTLFLDEIGETPFHLQVKLLRALQEGEIMPVGATQPKKVNVRIICATNKNLEEEVEAGTFREDLYYRINTFVIDVPPLRQRPEDIELLATHFLKHFGNAMAKPGYNFSDECMKQLRKCSFPGNVRQLKNEVQRALLLVEDNKEIEMHLFSPQLNQVATASDGTAVDIEGRTLKEAMETYEIKIIRHALDKNEWNKSQTAKLLGISRQAFMAKLSKYSISQ